MRRRRPYPFAFRGYYSHWLGKPIRWWWDDHKPLHIISSFKESTCDSTFKFKYTFSSAFSVSRSLRLHKVLNWIGLTWLSLLDRSRYTLLLVLDVVCLSSHICQDAIHLKCLKQTDFILASSLMSGFLCAFIPSLYSRSVGTIFIFILRIMTYPHFDLCLCFSCLKIAT